MRAKRPHDYAWRDHRLAVDLVATIRLADEASVICQVTNVSAAGFLAEAKLPIGHRVVAAIEGVGEVEAQVRWSLGRRSGLAFTQATGAVHDLIAQLDAGARQAADDGVWTELSDDDGIGRAA